MTKSEFYLLNYDPGVKQYGEKRRGQSRPSGTIVVHTAENLADMIGADTGAENVARFIAERTTFGSYHRLVDSDSIIKMAPLGYECWHDTATNPWSIGLSAAVRAGDWLQYPDEFETAVLRNMAIAAADIVRDMKSVWGIEVPIKRITRSEALAKKPGFLGHGDVDSGRRSDPGKHFDWTRFFKMIELELAGKDSSIVKPPASKPKPKPKPKPAKKRIDEDGAFGSSSIGALQKDRKTPVDYKISAPSLLTTDIQKYLNSLGFKGLDGKKLKVDGLGLRSNVGSTTPATNTQAAIQRRLKHLGYYNGPIDGRFDKNKSDAVVALQKSINDGHWKKK